MKQYVKYGLIASIVCGTSIYGLKSIQPDEKHHSVTLSDYQSYVNNQLSNINNKQEAEFSKENILTILDKQNVNEQTFFYIAPDKIKLQPYGKNDIHFIFNGQINRINANINKNITNGKMTISENDTREHFPVVIEGDINYEKYRMLMQDHRIGDFIKYGKITTFDDNGNQNNIFLDYKPTKYIANNIVVTYPDTEEALKSAFFDVFDYLKPYHINNNQTFFSYFENSLGEQVNFDQKTESFDISYSSTVSFIVTVLIIIAIIIAICILLLLFSNGVFI